MSWFTPDDRRILGRLADVLIPRAEGMPSASEAGAVDTFLDRVVNVRPDLAPVVLRVIRDNGFADPEAAVRKLHQHHGEVFAALGLAISAAYYMNPSVLALLHFPGAQRQPEGLPALSDFVTSGLLAPVRKRGPQWRPAA